MIRYEGYGVSRKELEEISCEMVEGKDYWIYSSQDPEVEYLIVTRFEMEEEEEEISGWEIR